MKQNHEYFKDNSLLVKHCSSSLLLLIFAFPSAFASVLGDSEMYKLRSPRQALALISPQPAEFKRVAGVKSSFLQNSICGALPEQLDLSLTTP